MATNIISQEESKLDKPKQHLLIQKITNLISTGDDNTSYKKTIDKLARKLLEEVGTERTTERPINIIENNLKKLEIEKQELEENKTKKIQLEEINKKIKNEQTEKINGLEIIKAIKRKKEEENIEEEIIKINEKSLEEIKNKKEKINENKKEEKINKKEKNNLIYILIFTIILILTVASFLINANNLIKYILLFLSILAFIFLGIKINKDIKIKNKKIEEKNKIKKEQEILENLISEKNEEIKKLKNKKEEKNNAQKIEIKNKYNLSEKIIEDYFACNLEEIKNILEKKENEIKSASLKIHEVEIESKSIMANLEKAAQIEEEIQNQKEKKQELVKLSNAIQIAKQTIEEAYDEMKNKVTPEFTKNLSKAAEQISQNRYKNVKFSDEEGLTVEKENGEFIGANRLSTGTIDQMYLSLRLSIASQISKEKIPIILDEAFAYYDDERLKSSMQYLAENYKEYQIIILTCSTREKEALEELKLKYNEITM